MEPRWPYGVPPKPKSTSDVKSYLDTIEPIIEQGINDVKSLSPPSSDQSTFNQWTAILDKELSLVKKAQSQAASNPQQAVQTLQSFSALER